MKKIIFSIATVIVLIIGVISFGRINKKIEKHKEQVKLENDIEESRKLIDIDDGSIWTTRAETLKLLSKHNVEWDKVLVPEELKKEYMQKYPNGLFGDDDYDECILEDYLEYEAGEYYEPNDFVFITIKGKRENKYKIHVGDEQYCHIYKIEKIELSDNNGDYVWKGYPMDEEHWISNLQKIALQDNEEVGKSEDFYDRYPNFTGILNPYHYTNIGGIRIKWNNDVNNNDKKIDCKVYYPALSEDYEFQVTFNTDENEYLKDYKVDIIKKTEHYFNSDDFKDIFSLATIKRLVYDNRSFSKLNITNNFRNNYSNDIYDEFHCIEIQRIIRSKEIDNKCIVKARDIDNNIIYIGLTYLLDNDKIDKVEYVKLALDTKIETNSSNIDLLNLF